MASPSRINRRVVLARASVLGGSLLGAGWRHKFARADGPRVLVGGAGFAGLAAAQTLAEAGYQVTVYEGRNRIGGRVLTDRTLGSPVDLGASWIHGIDGNPIKQLADRNGIETISTDFESGILFDFDGAPLSDDQVERGESMLEDLFDSAIEFAWDQEEDRSIGDAIRAVLADSGESISEADRRWIDYGSTELEIFTGANIDDLSSYWWKDDEAFGGDHVVFPNGYDEVVNALASELDVELQRSIVSISHFDDGVEFNFEDGSTAAGNIAIVTFPLGVLKAGTVEFDPPLPDEHQLAVERLGMGVLNKVAMRFTDSFWPEVEWLNMIPPDGRSFTEFLSLSAYTGEPILVALTGGPFADTFNSRADDDIVDEAMTVLRAMFPGAPDPEAVTITRWGTDPFALGSYSHIPVGASGEDFETLGTPVSNRLVLAGEHTTREYPNTVHGAFLSGLRAAEQIMATASVRR